MAAIIQNYQVNKYDERLNFCRLDENRERDMKTGFHVL